MLDQILSKTYKRVELLKKQRPLEDLKAQALEAPAPTPFAQLFNQRVIIAEVKFASPSKGKIREKEDILSIVSDYIEAGANAISVLTEPDFFQGELSFISQIRKEFHTLPVLQKDFFVDPYQIYLARSLGASTILLMASVLEKSKLEEMLKLSLELGLQPIVEVHDREELKLAKELNAPIIGINNRNLKSLEVDVKTSFQLSHEINDQHIFISESGISCHDQIKELTQAGFKGFLIGSHLMASADPKQALKDLLCE